MLCYCHPGYNRHGFCRSLRKQDYLHEHDIWLHVDAAMGGTALILPEYQWMLDGGNTSIRGIQSS